MHSTQETPNDFHDGAIFAFRNTILFRGIGTRKLLEETMLTKSRTKVIGDIFSTIVKLEGSDSSLKLCFDHLQETHKKGQDLRFLLH